MPSPAQWALMLGPLSLYFYVLGVWHSGRHPRVVGGARDLALLALGVGGFVVFGPVGTTLTGLIFGGSDPFGRLALASLLAMLVALRGARAARRLVVYNVEPEALRRAVGEVLAEAPGLGPGTFARTLHGFDEPEHGRALVVEASPRGRTATVEASGRGAEALIRRLRPGLVSRLRRIEAGPSAVPWLLIGLSLALVAPLLVLLLGHPRTVDALRAVLQRLQGG